MGSAWNQLEQMLTCAICLDKFKNPRLLPCQHSFCGDSCMDGLVDYARRQIKCPECRAEHRIPYQGLQNLPLNVTLIRFLELHSRITGEDTEPLPTFMEKCSICGEKIEGVTRCAHCEKKVCPECKEAHIDILRREVGRVNGQTKRFLSKLKDFREQIDRAQGKLKVNHAQVRKEIQDSCKRLIEDLETKQKRLIEEVDLFAEQEDKTLDKLRQAAQDELIILDSNSKLADEKFQSSKYQWTDVELWELKEIYARAMEFIRLFDADLGDFGRKIRFMIIPEFDSIKKRLCELGELKFADSTAISMAQALQYCNAVGHVAQEIYVQAATTQQQNQSNLQLGAGGGGYSLAHSNSNSNMLVGVSPLGHHQAASGASGLLELPGMQNALMRSQSDHRLASQFQQRLKQQQREREQLEKSTSRYGRPSTTMTGGATSGLGSDYDSEATLRSRYAPPRSSIGSKDAYDLTRDWPRPSDSDTDFGGGSIQFKSAFMRRKGNQYGPGSVSSGANSTTNTMMDDDDDLISEASYGVGGGGRNVRFNTTSGGADELSNNQSLSKLFDVKELERSPFSGVPKLEDSTHLATRLHQMGAKAIVEKKQAEEEKARDKDLIESAKKAMDQAKLASKKQPSEDDIEKQKKANKLQQESTTTTTSISAASPNANNISTIDRQRRISSPEPFMSEREPEDLDPDPIPVQETPAANDDRTRSNVSGGDEASTATSTAKANTDPGLTAITNTVTTSDQQQEQTPVANSRRNLYSQAITEKSRRQLANAIQEASTNPRGRAPNRGSQDNNASIDLGASSAGNQADSPSSVASSSSGATRTRRALRSSGRSMSKQSSTDQLNNTGSDTGTIQRRPRRLVRAETTSFQQASQDDPPPAKQSDTQESKNSTVGSVGQSGDSSSWSLDRSGAVGGVRTTNSRSQRLANHQSTNTTDDDEPKTAKLSAGDQTSSFGRRPIATNSAASTTPPAIGAANRSRFKYSSSKDDDQVISISRSNTKASSSGQASRNQSLKVDDSDDSDKDSSDNQQASSGLRYTGRTGHRKSREFLPNAVNKLLDRSAQIRRDSQEARGRGDSPQRSNTGTPTTGTGATSYYSSTSRQSSEQQEANSYPSSRSRYAYQRSGSNAIGDPDERATNSSNSVYTTASSSAYQSPSQSGTVASSRKSSNEEDNSSSLSYSSRPQRTSNSGADSTIISGPVSNRRTNYSSHRQDSGDATPTTTFQSRFLSRSRTSSALADSNTYDSSSHGDSPIINSSSNSRSTSSRDRFLQSTNAALSSSSGSHSLAGSTKPTSSSLYTRGSSSTSATTDFNQFDTVNNASREDADEIQDGHSSSALSDEDRCSSFSDEKEQVSIASSNCVDEHDESIKKKGNQSNQSKCHNETDSKSGKGIQKPTILEDGYSSSAHDIARDKNDNNKISKSQRNYDDVSNMVLKIGLRGNEPGQFTWPRGVVANDTEILVADSSNHRIQVFDLAGNWLREFGNHGNGDGQFDCLAGVTICEKPERRYVVSDRYNHRVQIFTTSGQFESSFGAHGREPGNFNLPWGVCCSVHSDLIYVCDKENHRVQIFTCEGEYLSQLGNGQCGSQPGQMQFPHYIAATTNSKIAVTDTNNHRVQVFDSSTGQVVQCFGSEGTELGQFKFPRGIAIDRAGCFVVGDSGNNRVQIFDQRCSPIKSLGCWGSASGQFKGIEGIAVEPKGGRILVCDRENHRIQLF